MKIAIITARGGSKGLPRKNVLNLKGIPLIAYTIKAAINCNSIERVFVSTEDKEIKNISKQFGAEIINRPSYLASDHSSSEEVIEDAIQQLESKNINFNTVVLLQPTSPLRTSKHIEEAIDVYNVKRADCVLSVFEPSHTPVKAYIEKSDGSIIGLHSVNSPYTRRQELPNCYQANGAIYVFSAQQFKLNNKIPRENVFPYLMSQIESVDIDTKEDMLMIEKIIERKK